MKSGVDESNKRWIENCSPDFTGVGDLDLEVPLDFFRRLFTGGWNGLS